MLRNMRTKFLLLFVLFVSVVSCSSKEDIETRENRMHRGFKMIDEKKYDDAISYFTDLAAKDDHYQIKLALASSYAARAGVKIENIYGFVVAKHSPTVDLQLSDLPLDQQVNNTIDNLQKIATQWEHVPSVSLNATADLQTALRVLAQNTEPGVRLYAATLRVVVLKSNINEGVKNWNRTRKNKQHICTKDLRPYWEWILKIINGLKVLTVDLEYSFPQRSEDILQMRAEIEKFQEQASEVVLKGDQCF